MSSFPNHRLVFVLGLVLLFFLPLKGKGEEPRPESLSSKSASKGKSFSMKELIGLVLEKSTPVQIQKLEILKADTGLRKNNSQYAPVIESGVEKKVTKQRYTNSFTSGDTTETTSSYIKAKKLFSSGTYFETGFADRYKSSEKVDNPAFSGLGGGSSTFTPAKLHSANLSIVLRQELLKNSFGYNLRRNNEIQRNKAYIQRQNLIYNLSNLVVSIMIDFWQLAIAQEEIRTSRRLLENTNKIRSITIRKRRLGLAEAFEVQQWKALLSQVKTRLGGSKLRHADLEKKLLRTLDLKAGEKLDPSAKLESALPKKLDLERDLQFAYQTRPDYRALLLQKENARKSLEIAENQLLPSLSVGARYNSQGFDREFSQAYEHSREGEYPEYSLDFKVEYPLWDEGLKADKRNAKISLKQIDLEEKQLRRQIRDEIQQAIQEIQVARQRVLDSKTALSSNRSYYKGLVRRYRQGRFSATAVKNALDTLVQSEQGLTESIVNFNIALVRYALSCNRLFKNYGFDIDKIVDSMQTQIRGLETKSAN